MGKHHNDSQETTVHWWKYKTGLYFEDYFEIFQRQIMNEGYVFLEYMFLVCILG